MVLGPTVSAAPPLSQDILCTPSIGEWTGSKKVGMYSNADADKRERKRVKKKRVKTKNDMGYVWNAFVPFQQPFHRKIKIKRVKDNAECS